MQELHTLTHRSIHGERLSHQLQHLVRHSLARKRSQHVMHDGAVLDNLHPPQDVTDGVIFDKTYHKNEVDDEQNVYFGFDELDYLQQRAQQRTSQPSCPNSFL